jgi:DNA-binding transcriptional MerR regulator
MTEMTKETRPMAPLTVGQLAERFGVTVRTLHHYDEIGLLVPSDRSAAGYRLYTEADVTRLRHVVVYRRLGFALEDITLLLDDPSADLRRQRAAVMSRLDEMRGLVAAIDKALENEMNNKPVTDEDMRELFGDSFDDYLEEARERWGETDAWKQSQQRTRNYTKADWEAVKAETDALNTRS